MHRQLSLVAASGVAAAGALFIATALPAAAATAGRADDTPPITCTVPAGSGAGTPCTHPDVTPVTFSVASTGTLNITAPEGIPPIPLGTAISSTGGSTIGTVGDFGYVTVTDYRAVDPSPWTATVSCSDFLNTTTGLPADTIPATAATYITGTPAADTVGGPGVGSGLPFDIALTGSTVGLTNAAQTIMSETGFAGDNAATWDATINVAIPPNAVVGIYNANVTHSVS